MAGRGNYTGVIIILFGGMKPGQTRNVASHIGMRPSTPFTPLADQ